MGSSFGGRCKAIVVQHQEGSSFRRLVDYLHFKPVRAGLVGKGEGSETCEWSKDYCQAKIIARRQVRLDEFPFASTATGGRFGPAEARLVSARENNRQGGDLGRFYNQLGGAREFLVVPVPRP